MPELSLKKLARLLDPAAFVFTGAGELARTAWATRAVRWEVHHGRLLPERFSTQMHSFLACDLIGRAIDREVPFISLLIDEESRAVHVVRYLRVLVNEPYTTDDNVVLTRQVPGWTREMVASVRIDDFTDEAALLRDLRSHIFEAIVGVSKLPLTSVEAPLPEYSFGRLMYLGEAGETAGNRDGPFRHWTAVVDHIPQADPRMRWKWLEFLLRAIDPDECQELAARLGISLRSAGIGAGEFASLVRATVNDVSLSPYTGFADNLLKVLAGLVEMGFLPGEQHVDLLSWILRQLCRHLTAYDLVVFHHHGANYPDALFLDAVLKAYLREIARHTGWFMGAEGRLRRRALRQAFLVRKRYEGHPVPDAPTSPGENVRILEDVPPVPEEQIVSIGKRSKRLYADDPLEAHLGSDAVAVLRESIMDLDDERELRELGTAVFIDRPLGLAKFPGEPDRTPLFSHVAWSRKVTQTRLRELAQWQPARDIDWQTLQSRTERLPDGGIPAEIYCRERRGVVSLADAYRAADDFRFTRTTETALAAFIRDYLQGTGVRVDEPWLLLPQPTNPNDREITLVGYDRHFKPRWQLVADLRQGYRLRSGWDYPAAGFQLHRVECGK